MQDIKKIEDNLKANPRSWLITGVAGFIGSNLLEYLLNLDQKVCGLDNFSTGKKSNIDEVLKNCADFKDNFTLIEGDITNLETCQKAVNSAEIILHQAALGSVPRSIADPISTNKSNVDGFLNMLVAARGSGKRFVYASSSSVYGDSPKLPKIENEIGQALSPYAVSKAVNEQYAKVFKDLYEMEIIGLRYFNVFGKRQDPLGQYAAVIPKWIGQLLSGAKCEINGDGQISRDFCHVSNVIQANILAAFCQDKQAFGKNFNIAVSQQTTLNQLYQIIKTTIEQKTTKRLPLANYAHERPGDVKHSLANIELAKKLLGYHPSTSLSQAMPEVIDWYLK